MKCLKLVSVLFFFSVAPIEGIRIPSEGFDRVTFVARGVAVAQVPEVLATYTSLKTHLYEKSCTMCHNQDFQNKRMPPLDTYDDAKAFAELSLKYIEVGLMPKMNTNFRVPPEIPTDEVVEKLREWIALDYPL